MVNTILSSRVSTQPGQPQIDIDGPSYRQHVAHERARARGGAPPDDTTDP
jgi:hypothetical protein